MVKKIELKRDEDRFKVKMHIAMLVILLAISVAVGFAISQKTNSITGQSVKENCVPQTEIQKFADETNAWRANYQQCVAEVWNLQLANKMAEAKKLGSNITSNNS